jgi:hypothetical protein
MIENLSEDGVVIEMSTVLLIHIGGLVITIVFSMISRKVLLSIFAGMLIMVIVDIVLVVFVGDDSQGIFIVRPIIGAVVGGFTSEIAGLIKP